jgi:hypothetical protein
MAVTKTTPPTGDEERVEALSIVGRRPECFSSTIKECLFVLTATMSIGMSSFLYGLCTVITAPIAKDLGMTSAEVTWIGASSACVYHFIFQCLSFHCDDELEFRSHKNLLEVLVLTTYTDFARAHSSFSSLKSQTHSAAEVS